MADRKMFVILGAGAFGKLVLEDLIPQKCDIVLIDKNADTIDLYKDDVSLAYEADIINEEILKRYLPRSTDAAIVDLGRDIEVSILVTNYLKKMGISRIIVKAESSEHGEILEIVGATEVVFPDREAAKRIAPALLSNDLHNFLPVSRELTLAEVVVPEKYRGKGIPESGILKDEEIQVLAIKLPGSDEYILPEECYQFNARDIVLVLCPNSVIDKWTGIETALTGNISFFDVFRRKNEQ